MHAIRAIIAFATLALGGAIAQAASVLAVGTSDLTARSDFIFHGKAVRSWVEAASGNGAIHTYMEFTVTDVLKGDRNRRSVTLSFLGGVLNGRGMRVEGLVLPRIGEEGIYFVERLGRRQVHPLYGWNQGRFLVHGDTENRKSVFTYDMKPVRGFEAVSASPGLAKRYANGVTVADDKRLALSLATFKLRVRALVEAQQ